MKIPKLNLCTSIYSDAGFLVKVGHVFVSMTGNDSFPDPVPPLAAFKVGIDAFSASIDAASGGSGTAIAFRNEKRAELEALYVQLGLYVMYVALSNVPILVSSGFTVAKEPEPVYIQNPGNVTLVNGVTSGVLESSVGAVKGCKLYLHEISDSEPTENTVWDARTCSRSRYSFKGLVPGRKYWVRVAVTGAGEQIAYSALASQYVL